MRVDRHVTAEIFEPADESSDDLAAVEAVEVVGSVVVVVDAVAEHEVAGVEHRGGDGQDGLLGAATGLEAQELGTQVAVLLADGRPGGGDEGGLEPGGSLAQPGGAAFSGT